MGQNTANEKIILVETVSDANNLMKLKDLVAYVTQTTLSVDDTKDIIEILKKKVSLI